MRRTVRPQALSQALSRALGPTLIGVALGLTLIGVGCTMSVDVAFDERRDFSHYRTWDWLSRGAFNVDAAAGTGHALEAQLARIIEKQLGERGFTRTDDGADFLVSYHLSVRPRTEVVNQPFAPYLLLSMDSSPSYLIEGSDTVVRRHKDFLLTIGLRAGGEITWKGSLKDRVEGDAALPLEDCVATLLERFPRRETRSDEAKQR